MDGPEYFFSAIGGLILIAAGVLLVLVKLNRCNQKKERFLRASQYDGRKMSQD